MGSKLDINQVYQNLFKLSDPFNNKAIRFNYLDSNSNKSISADEWKNYRINWLLPYGSKVIYPDFGSTSYDILWSTDVFVFISKRLVTILEKAKATGWEAYPIIISDPSNKLKDNYFGFKRTGMIYKQEYKRSSFESREAPTPFGHAYHVYKGMFFNEVSYDGNDFFRIDGSIIINRKVKLILNKFNVKNIRLTPLLDVEINKSLVDIINWETQ